MQRVRCSSDAAMSRRAQYKFRLFVAGQAENSTLAIANLRALCRTYLPKSHAIELVDVFREPQRALAESIFMTPTLVVIAPPPVRRIVGTLSQTQTVLHALGIGDAVA